MAENTSSFNVFPVFFRGRTSGFLGGDEGRRVVGWKTAEMGDEVRNRRIQGRERKRDNDRFTPGAIEKPRTKVRAFLDRIW